MDKIDGLINSKRNEFNLIENSASAYKNLQYNNSLGVDLIYANVVDVKNKVRDKKVNDSNNVLDFDYSDFSRKGLSWNIAFLDDVMRREAYISNAVTWIANKSLSKGIDLNIRRRNSKDLELITNITDYLSSKLKKPLFDFLSQGISYGGSGALIVVGDEFDKEEMIKPLTIDSVKYGDNIALRPLTRLYQIQPIITNTGNMGEEDVMIGKIGKDVGIYDDTELGKPQYWRVSISGNMFDKDKGTFTEKGDFTDTFIVHRSRVLIFNSSELSWVDRKVEQYFGISIIVKALDSIKRYKEALNEIMSLLKRSNVPVLNSDFGSLSGSRSNSNYLKNVEDVITSYYYALEGGGIIVLGSKEKETLEFIQAEFKELTNILLDRKKELSADLQAPVSVTFNEEPKIDENVSYYGVNTVQERQLRPAYYQLIPLIAKATVKDLEEMPDYSFEFRSLEYLSEKGKAEKQKIIVETVNTAFQSNLLTKYDAKIALIIGNDNVEDMFNHIVLEEEDKNRYANDDKTDLANVLNNAKMFQNNNNGKVYDPNKSSEAGKGLGGRQDTSRKVIDK